MNNLINCGLSFWWESCILEKHWRSTYTGLTKKHHSMLSKIDWPITIYPNGFQKMKVKFGTQVLNHSVSAAMLIAVDGGLLPWSAVGTTELISTVHLLKVKRLTINQSNHSLRTANLCDMCSFDKKIEVNNPATGEDVTSIMKCSKALQTTLNGTVLVWKSIQSITKFYMHETP